MRFVGYVLASIAVASSISFAAFSNSKGFYTACVYIQRSSGAMMAFMNLGLLLTVMVGKVLQRIFFGPLRAVEVEHLYERSWFAVTETCLAMTIFRDEFDTRFVAIFTLLLFLKIFHWLAQDRVDYIEQSPVLSNHFHLRMTSLILTLTLADAALVTYAISSSIEQGPNMMIMFGFEYTILLATISSTGVKYVLHHIDMQTEDPWENKSIYMFYLDLTFDFIKLITYLIFFSLILSFYGLPLHIVRDVYLTLRSFAEKLRDLVRFRQATRNMNERYADATEEELVRMSDRTCIICREELGRGSTPVGRTMQGAEPPRENEQPLRIRPKKLPCGHCFHFHCLRSWLERQQSCPICRRSVLDIPAPPPQPQPRPTPQPTPQPPLQPHAHAHPHQHPQTEAQAHINSSLSAASTSSSAPRAVPQQTDLERLVNALQNGQRITDADFQQLLTPTLADVNSPPSGALPGADSAPSQASTPDLATGSSAGVAAPPIVQVPAGTAPIIHTEAISDQQQFHHHQHHQQQHNTQHQHEHQQALNFQRHYHPHLIPLFPLPLPGFEQVQLMQPSTQATQSPGQPPPPTSTSPATQTATATSSSDATSSQANNTLSALLSSPSSTTLPSTISSTLPSLTSPSWTTPTAATSTIPHPSFPTSNTSTSALMNAIPDLKFTEEHLQTGCVDEEAREGLRRRLRLLRTADDHLNATIATIFNALQVMEEGGTTPPKETGGDHPTASANSSSTGSEALETAAVTSSPPVPTDVSMAKDDVEAHEQNKIDEKGKGRSVD